MSKAYYSTVLTRSPDTIWALVRDFDNYPRYIEGVVESRIEGGKPGDSVGAVRSFRMGDNWIRQRLVALSDAERTITYAGCCPFSFPSGKGDATIGPPSPISYEGTLRLTPVVEGDRTFVEWWVTFESGREDAARWKQFLVAAIGQWVGSLDRALDAALSVVPGAAS